MAVIDASVLVSRFLRTDVNHVTAVAWLRTLAARGERFRAPSIVLSEVVGPVQRAIGDEARARRVLGVLLNPVFMELFSVTESRAAAAADLAIRGSLKGCDAVYVGLAEELGDVLITFDAEQSKRSSALVRVPSPGEVS